MSEHLDLQEDTEAVSCQEPTASESGDEIMGMKAENEQLKARLAELEKTCEDLIKEDKYRMAEFDNYRRRTRLEQEELRKTATKSLLVELLDIEDGFVNAFDGSETADLVAWKEGITLIARKFHSLLEKYGVKPIEADGSEFDPLHHEAIVMVDEGDHEGLLVTQVIQSGYLLHDKVLRLAKVKVARGVESSAEQSIAEETN